ncbi:TRAP transporter large permease [Ruegeria atlantica]|uniref:TRAP transporter large permease n=1 Tax=Ruegeria atlantica TaxID=81569 RepID=UPI00147E0ACD|nr:TRAP transporter large permease [Ruegeria atlantica]
MLLLIIGLAIALFILGFEMVLVLGVPTFLLKETFFGKLPDEVLLQKIVGGINHPTLLAIPFFILAAEAMTTGQIASRLTGLVRSFLGHRRGGIGNSTVGSSMVFGAVSGSAAATVAAIGKIMYPELKKAGYNDKFSLGVIVSSAETAMLIPPSITIIIYGWLTGTSITKLFAAGLVIGVLLGVFFGLYVYWETGRQNAANADRVLWRERWTAVKGASWALGLPVIILGGIYSGYFTATEAASVSVVYAILVEAFVYRELTWEKLFNIFERAAITTCVIFVLIGMGSVLSYFLTLFQLPHLLQAFITDLGAGPLTFLLFVNIVFLIAGMFIDPSSAMLILIPPLYPIAVILGIDPVHFGMVVTLNIGIAMITPPFGLDIYVASSTLNKPVLDVISGVWPFLLVNFAALAVVTLLPQVSTFFPSLLGL